MNYSSKLGCVLYYDTVLCHQGLCEPTMLFLFGLEAILTDASDYIIIVPVIDKNTGKPVIDPETGEVVTEEKPNKYNLKTLRFSRDKVGSLFDDIYRYLYHTNDTDPVTVDEINYDCNGMKLFLNELTGTDNSRIIPVIFHEDYDANVLAVDWSDLDAVSKKISDIFEDAGYDSDINTVRFLSKFGITDEDVLDSIQEYNKELESIYLSKKSNGMIYKLLDYKAMYSYALGVLYGCTLIGYDASLIWRVSPDEWFDAEDSYFNLVSTAYDTFKFHYSHPIPKIDCDGRLWYKYKGVQCNKLWNFDNSSFSLKSDEISCRSLYIENNTVIELPFIYSQSTGPQNPIPGSYLIVGDNIWNPLDQSVIDDETKKGIIADNDNMIIRYIANDEVSISRAYRCSTSCYLSPNNEDKYFVYTGSLGWVNFDENSFSSYSTENPILTFAQIGFSSIPRDQILIARNKDTGNTSLYYKCYVTNDHTRYLVGILPDNVIDEIPDDTHFKDILSDEYFELNYEFPIDG